MNCVQSSRNPIIRYPQAVSYVGYLTNGRMITLFHRPCKIQAKAGSVVPTVRSLNQESNLSRTLTKGLQYHYAIEAGDGASNGTGFMLYR
jgi:hypothetical protein